MQLKIKRSQRDGGVLGNTAVFCIEARVALTQRERDAVKRYKLHNQVLYNSKEAEKHIAHAEANLDGKSVGGLMKGLAHAALSRMALSITVASLEKGQKVECKDLDEVLGAEEAIIEACRSMKTYLDLAATFNGMEAVVDFSGEKPLIVAEAGVSDATFAELPPPEPEDSFVVKGISFSEEDTPAAEPEVPFAAPIVPKRKPKQYW
jgi:hypothetical protein